jgi:hypothetical protein
LVVGGGLLAGGVVPLFWVGGVPLFWPAGVVALPGAVDGLVASDGVAGVGDGLADGVVVSGAVAGGVAAGGVVDWSSVRLLQPPNSATDRAAPSKTRVVV